MKLPYPSTCGQYNPMHHTGKILEISKVSKVRHKISSSPVYQEDSQNEKEIEIAHNHFKKH